MTLGLVHTPKVGTTQVGNLDFNSLCKLDDGVLLAANENGIHTLDTSGSDDGTDINAWFQFPRTAFGFLNQKRIKKLICSFEADGRQVIRVSTDEGTWVDRDLVPFLDDQKSEGMIVPIGRELKGGHFEIEWRNDNGSDFSVDAIDVMLTLLHSRAGRSRFFKPWLVEDSPFPVIVAGNVVRKMEDLTQWQELSPSAYYEVTEKLFRMIGAPVNYHDTIWEFAYIPEDVKIVVQFFASDISAAATNIYPIVLSSGGNRAHFRVSPVDDQLMVYAFERIAGQDQEESAEISVGVHYLLEMERIDGHWYFRVRDGNELVFSTDFLSYEPTQLYDYVSIEMFTGTSGDDTEYVTVGPLHHDGLYVINDYLDGVWFEGGPPHPNIVVGSSVITITNVYNELATLSRTMGEITGDIRISLDFTYTAWAVSSVNITDILTISKSGSPNQFEIQIKLVDSQVVVAFQEIVASTIIAEYQVALNTGSQYTFVAYRINMYWYLYVIEDGTQVWSVGYQSTVEVDYNKFDMLFPLAPGPATGVVGPLYYII